MPPTLLAKAAADRTPATRPSSVSEGVEAPSQMVWLEPPIPRSSDATLVPAILREHGMVTSPSPMSESWKGLTVSGGQGPIV
jgi:hypothetical protein